MSEQNPATVVNKGNVEAKQYSAFRTIYLLLGGTGMKVGMRLRRRVLEAHGIAQLPFQEYLWLDTDPRDMRNLTIGESETVSRRLELPQDDILSMVLPFDRVRQFRDNPQDFPWLESWLDLDMLRDLGESARAVEGAAQIRALGRLAFSNKIHEFRRAYTRRYERLCGVQLESEVQKHKYTLDGNAVGVTIVCSLAGGTGSGCFIEAARVIRELSNKTPVNITAYLLMPSIYMGRIEGQEAEQEVQANGFAALRELNALSALTKEGFRAPPLWIDNLDVKRPGSDPFSQIYLIDAWNDDGQTLAVPYDDDAYDMLADALYFDFEQSEFGTKIRSHRCNVLPRLGSTSYRAVPVQDGNAGAPGQPNPEKTGQRSYVFRFPNAFGAFGLARIPFERHRLQRAAGAWLAQNMLRVLTSPPEKQLSRDEVLKIVVEPELTKAKLSVDQVLERILQDGETRATFDQAAARRVSEGLAGLRAEVESFFGAAGLPDDERLERLSGADAFGRQLRDKAQAVIDSGRKEVMDNLSDRGPRLDWGPHMRAIEDVQNQILVEYKASFEEFVVRLLSQARSHGYTVAELACELIRNQLIRLSRADGGQDDRLDVANLDLDPGSKVQRAGELRASAEALLLPGYRTIARNFYRRDSRRLLQAAGSSCAQQARTFLDGLDGTFAAWARARYRDVASAHSSKLFDALNALVGEQVEVEDDPTHPEAVRVTATGLRQRLLFYRRACDESADHFAGLHASYSMRRRSARDGKDLTPYDGIRKAVEDALSRGDVRASVTFEDKLVEQWQDFFTEKGMLSAGQTSPFRSGVEDLLERAAARQRNRKRWAEVEGWLEEWTTERLVTGGYLAQEDAINILAKDSQHHAETQIKHVARGAHPWLQFDDGRGDPSALVPIAYVGSPSPDAELLESWGHGAGGAFQNVFPNNVIKNDSGSVVVYAEKMAFPLYCVKSLAELSAAYAAVLARNNHDIARRHTVRNHLDLPVILPPQDPEEAQAWFLSDRMVLEAVLLGIFQPGEGSDVQYTYVEKHSNVRRVSRLPGTLGSIAAKLRQDDRLYQAIKLAVGAAVKTVLSSPDSAISALALADWTQNTAFPGKEKNVYLEHELAASLFQKWMEATAQRTGLHFDEQIAGIARVELAEVASPSPVSAWALQDKVGPLRALHTAPAAVRGAAEQTGTASHPW